MQEPLIVIHLGRREHVCIMDKPWNLYLRVQRKCVWTPCPKDKKNSRGSGAAVDRAAVWIPRQRRRRIGDDAVPRISPCPSFWHLVRVVDYFLDEINRSAESKSSWTDDILIM